MAAFRQEMLRIKQAFKASGGKLDPDLVKNWDRVVFENGKTVWGRYDPQGNIIKVYRIAAPTKSR